MKTINKLLLYSVSVIVFLISFLPAYASDNKTTGYWSTPQALIQEIESKGAKPVVSELYSNTTTWSFVLRRIASGEQSWLKVAVALHAGADAGASGMLTLAVGEALGNNPKNVFTIAAESFELSNICAGPDVDDARYNSYKLSIKEINKRIEKISAVKDRSTEKTGKECIQYLEASKKGIADFYGKK